MPMTRCPSRTARMVMARMAGFSPGTSPPPVRIAMVRLPLMVNLSSPRRRRRQPDPPGQGRVARVGAEPVPARVVAHIKDQQRRAVFVGPLQPGEGLVPVAQPGVDERDVVWPDVAPRRGRLEVVDDLPRLRRMSRYRV